MNFKFIKKSNCLFYAFKKYRRYGGYILMRKSNYGWWPHFLHMTKDGKITQYTLSRKKRRILPPIVFTGFVKEGDSEKD